MIIGLQFAGVNRLIAVFLKMFRRLGESIRDRFELAEVSFKKNRGDSLRAAPSLRNYIYSVPACTLLFSLSAFFKKTLPLDAIGNSIRGSR